LTLSNEINVHYSGKIVEYQKPPYTIREADKLPSASRYIYHAKQEIKITDSIFYALQNKVNNLYFITLTYQWKDDIIYGLENRKKCNKDLNRFLKFIRDKRKISRYVGVLELTKRLVPHYHIILDCDLKQGKKKSRNYKQRETYYFAELQKHWNTITKNRYKNSLDYKPITKVSLRETNAPFKISKYLTKYFTKELKIIKQNRFDFGVRNYFISQKLRIKPVKIKSSSIMMGDFIEIQRKARNKYSLYWNIVSKNENWTENIHYYKDTTSYYVSPYGLPPLKTFISRTTLKKPFNTLYDRIKYIQSEEL